MKAICVLLVAFFCAANAMHAYEPQWATCFDGSFQFKTVTIDEAPVAGKKSTFHFCGVETKGTELDWDFAIVNSKDFILDKFIYNEQTSQYAVPFCYDVSLKIPEGVPKTLTLNFDIRGGGSKRSPDRVACLNVVLNF